MAIPNILLQDWLPLLKKIKIQNRRHVFQTLSGTYRSAFRGQGMAFEEVRPYQMGDELRSIDWNVTARMDTPYVKVFREERERILYLLVDQSPSMNFGTAKKLKSEMAQEIACFLALLALENQDQIGLILFNQRKIFHIPPGKKRNHVYKIIQAITETEKKSTFDITDSPLNPLIHSRHRGAIAFILSDFLQNMDMQKLKHVTRRHETTAILLNDARENVFSLPLTLELTDPETGETLSLSRSDFKNTIRLKKERIQTEKELIESGLRVLTLSTEESPTEKLMSFLSHRRRAF